jgi:phage terminase Nu1 subunit (DNA packaging protein)
MKRSRAARDVEQQAKGRLRAPGYADARTILAQEQARRIEQIRLAAERELIPAHEVRSAFVAIGEALRMPLLSIEKRLRAAHPDLDAAVYEFVRDANEDALRLLSGDVARLEKGK